VRELLRILSVVFAVFTLGAGCGSTDSATPPPIASGAACATCGMSVDDARFVATRRVDGRWLVYDAIECLVADRVPRAGGVAWLTDFETGALAPEGERWVLRGDFPSPMGGGLAAFADRAVADSLAVATRGSVARLADLPARGGAR